MATSTITNTITDAAGNALAGVPVKIRLIPGEAWRIDTGAEIAPLYETETNSGGTWSATLEETANISPAKTVTTAKYKIVNGICEVWIILGPTASGTAGSDLVFTLPVAGASIGFAGIGSGNIFDASASTIDAGQWIMLSSTTVSLRTSESGTASWGTSPSIAIANSDGIWAHLRYPIASAA